MKDDAKTSVPAPEAQKKAIEVGKRYMCAKCGFEFIVTRAGNGAILCCGEPVLKK